jgi:sialidase-1
MRLLLKEKVGATSLCVLAAVTLTVGLAAAEGTARAPEQNTGWLGQQILFHSGEGSYFCFRIPSLVVTSKKNIIAFAEARRTNCADWDQIDMVTKRSDDGGKTWSPLRILLHEGTRSINQPTPLLDRETGILWLVFCKDNQQVFVVQSGDDGVTWSNPREITGQVKERTWKYVASGPGHGIQLKNGRLLVAAWGDVSPGPAGWPPTWGETEFTFTMFSDDHGATWQQGRPMYENLTEEGMVTEIADGRVYMAMRSLHEKKRRAYAWSEDGGYSWSRIHFDDSLPDPPAEASILRISATGTGSAHRFLFANPASAVDRTHLTVRMSEDDCQTWPISKVLYEGSSAYSDLALADDDTILIFFEADDYSKLLLARFNLAWLTAGNASH